MKHTLDGINDRLGLGELKISEFQDAVIESIQNEIHREKKEFRNINKTPVIGGTTSSDLIHK